MNVLELNGYKAKIEFDPELEQFRGEILGLNGSADFYGTSLSALKKEFRNSLNVFLEVCNEKGIDPNREYSGKFNLRIPPKLHRKIATKAVSSSKSINQWVVEVLQHSVNE